MLIYENKQKAIAGGNKQFRSTAIKPSVDTKVQINTEEAISKLQILLKEYEGVQDLSKLYTNICVALNIYPSKEEQAEYKANTPPSRYGVFEMDIDTKSKTFSIRVSNHSANCSNYVEQDSNMDFNLSIVLNNKRVNRKKFEPDDRVCAKEYIYRGYKVKNVKCPALQILTSLITYLSTGIYVDTTGVAIVKTSPETPQATSNTDNTDNKHKNGNYIQNKTMKSDNKALYESIMKDVAKVVKQKLNEEVDVVKCLRLDKDYGYFLGKSLRFTEQFWDAFEEYCRVNEVILDKLAVKYIINFLGRWTIRHQNF